MLLRHLWNTSVQESDDTADKLWACSLVQTTVTPGDTMKSCIEVHAVISQYFVESIGSIEALTLSACSLVGLNTARAVVKGMLNTFQQSNGISDFSSPVLEIVVGHQTFSDQNCSFSEQFYFWSDRMSRQIDRGGESYSKVGEQLTSLTH